MSHWGCLIWLHLVLTGTRGISGSVLRTFLCRKMVRRNIEPGEPMSEFVCTALPLSCRAERG